MTTLNNQIKSRSETNSTVTIEEVVGDDPDLFAVIKLASYRVFEIVSWPYIKSWEILTSFVYIFFAPLQVAKLFTHALIATLQIFAQATQSVADGSFFEKIHFPDVNLVVLYKQAKESEFFKNVKEYLANSETLKRWVNEINQWASKLESKPQAVTNGEAKKDTIPYADEVDLDD